MGPHPRGLSQLHPGQSIHKEEFFQRELEREREELTKELEKHPDFELPYIIPTSFYRSASPQRGGTMGPHGLF